MTNSAPRVFLVMVLGGMALGSGSLPGFAEPPRADSTANQKTGLEFERPIRRMSQLDHRLKDLLDEAKITPIDSGPPSRRALIDLGRFLYYDKLLSGNRDISCATCHHDRFVTGDACSLSVGTGSEDIGPFRKRDPKRKFTPRNAPDVFNRGLSEWRTMFWDNRVEQSATGFKTPAKDNLPGGFTHVLQVQAMFPVTSRTEMRGQKGDRDVFGNLNELAQFEDEEFPAMWRALMQRLLGPDGAKSPHVPSYRQLFQKAYPKTPTDELGFQHAAAAIAAYERDAYTLLDSPWDRYLNGEAEAIDPSAKRGAISFYGKAGCAVCHSGNLMTDQKTHNILVPHVGSEELTERAEDIGRAKETEDPADKYAFRTPPLRNVAETGPWMHNGLYTTLEAAVRHHLDPVRSFQNYDSRQLTMRELRPLVHNSDKDLKTQIGTLSNEIKTPRSLSEGEMQDLIRFLEVLTSPCLKDLERNVPWHVPSGLLVD